MDIVQRAMMSMDSPLGSPYRSPNVSAAGASPLTTPVTTPNQMVVPDNFMSTIYSIMSGMQGMPSLGDVSVSDVLAMSGISPSQNTGSHMTQVSRPAALPLPGAFSPVMAQAQVSMNTAQVSRPATLPVTSAFSPVLPQHAQVSTPMGERPPFPFPCTNADAAGGSVPLTVPRVCTPADAVTRPGRVIPAPRKQSSFAAHSQVAESSGGETIVLPVDESAPEADDVDGDEANQPAITAKDAVDDSAAMQDAATVSDAPGGVSQSAVPAGPAAGDPAANLPQPLSSGPVESLEQPRTDPPAVQVSDAPLGTEASTVPGGGSTTNPSEIPSALHSTQDNIVDPAGEREYDPLVEYDLLVNVHLSVKKTLFRGQIYIERQQGDFLFYALKLLNGFQTSDKFLPGLFVRGKVCAFFNVGGMLQVQGRQMGWRTMAYQDFKKYCDIVESRAKTNTSEGGGDAAGAQIDKYVSKRFYDTAMNIEYENLCAANESLRLE